MPHAQPGSGAELPAEITACFAAMRAASCAERMPSLQRRVLDTRGEPIPGLLAVGEAADFGGGGACGKRSLEGTVLPGCIMTAKAAVAGL